MIPKIIHYCWLSGDPLGERERDCIESWRTLMPEYEIWLWDMNRFDIHSVPWVEQACSVRKWAFAADYIRLYALYHHGGIYMDTDVRLIKSLDRFTEHRAFGGIEFLERWYNESVKNHVEPPRGVHVNAAVFGSEKGHQIFKDFLDYYDGRDFIDRSGELDTIANTLIITPMSEKYGFKYDPKEYQILDHDFHIYPYDYFSGQKINAGDLNITYNTYAIHLFADSWSSSEGAGERHSRFTWFRRHTKDFWNDVVLGKRARKKIKK